MNYPVQRRGTKAAPDGAEPTGAFGLFRFSLKIIRALFVLALFAPAHARLSAQAAKPLAAEATRAELARYELAADYSKEFRGLSVLVLKGGRVVFEQYQNGHTAETPHMLASGTKSFSGVMAAAAVDDRLLKLDERVSDTITEWKSDPRRSKITIRQLLTLTSGVAGGRIGRPPTYAEATQSPAEHEAGAKFQYGPAPFQVFGELMRRKLVARKETPLDYMKRRFLDPIGLRVAFWAHQEGMPNLPSGAFLTAREWAKFGQFVLQGGKWNGKQLVSSAALGECFKGTATNPAYGLTFWLNAASARGGGASVADDGGFSSRRRETDRISEEGIYASGPRDLVMAAGAGKQRLYIIPALELVIVRQGRQSGFDDSEFLARLLDGKSTKTVVSDRR